MQTINLLEAAVWEAFYAEQAITDSMQALRAADAVKAKEVSEEITEILYSDAD